MMGQCVPAFWSIPTTPTLHSIPGDAEIPGTPPPLNQSHSVSSASQMYKKVRVYTIPVHLAKSPNKKALYLARTCTHTPGVDHTVDQQVSKLELARVDATRGHRPS